MVLGPWAVAGREPAPPERSRDGGSLATEENGRGVGGGRLGGGEHDQRELRVWTEAPLPP